MKRLNYFLARSLCALLAGIFLPATAVLAHEARPAYLEVTETAAGQYQLLWRTPVLAGMRLPVVLQTPETTRDLHEPVIQVLNDSVVERRWIETGPEEGGGTRFDFPGLQFTITDVLVRVQLQDGRSWMTIVRPSQPWVTIEANPDRFSTAVDFLQQGVTHMLSGPDHLLFVFGLLLLVSTPWVLVKTITAFTIAHSITLAMATLGYVQPPGPPIEVAIALSILFLGVEILRARRGGTSLAIRHPWVIAFAFGLLHGFGFAGALSAAGLPPDDVPLALLSFNLGVEFGQLAFVGAIALVMVAIRHLWRTLPHAVEISPAYLVGTLGAFWTLQRLAAMV